MHIKSFKTNILWENKQWERLLSFTATSFYLFFVYLVSTIKTKKETITIKYENKLAKKNRGKKKKKPLENKLQQNMDEPESK